MVVDEEKRKKNCVKLGYSWKYSQGEKDYEKKRKKRGNIVKSTVKIDGEMTITN